VTSIKIGLLGGTFDPVHNGHLQLAESALKEYRLDKVIFIPSAQPPHKTDTSVTSFSHRIAMLSLAGQGIDNFECSAIEGTLPKPSYTIDTLRELLKNYQTDCTLYFIIGADAFLDILTWKSYQEVLQTVHILISGRIGYKSVQLFDLLKRLGYRPNDNSWTGNIAQKDIYLLKKTPEEHSSSTIRALIEKGESVHRLIPRAVFDYIQKNKLYQPEKVGETTCSRNDSQR